ncbi:MAG: DNA internalization-related competence protein ComEC/Rec2 [Bacillus sp. (in: firmicutes)]
MFVALLLAVAAVLGVSSAFYSWKVLFLSIPFIFFLFLYASSRRVVVYMCAAMAFFFLVAHCHAYFKQPALSTSGTAFVVRFTDIPDVDGSSLQAIVSTPSKEKLLLRYTFKEEHEKNTALSRFRLGLTCAVVGNLQVAESNRNENAFNYREYLRGQNIHYILKAESNPLSACRSMKQSLPEKIKSIRMWGMEHIDRYFPPQAKGFAAALLFGESDGIAEELYNAYKTLSLVHILAISGMHVAVITASCFYLLLRAGITRESTSVILIILLPVYSILAGGAPSVVRACVMMMAFLLLSLWKIKISPVSLLSGILLLLLLINPFYLQQVGFQLSFFITFALLMSAVILQTIKRGKVLQSFVVTLICQICSMPIILFYFYEFSLWGFLLNILYIPLYTVILLPATVVAFAASIVHAPFAPLFFALLERLFGISNKIALLLADLPYASLSFGKPSFLFILFVAVLILTLFYFWEQKNKKPLLLCMSAICAGLFLFYHQGKLSPVGEVVFIDVGQGDSVLIKRPFGKGVYLIDTGGILSFGQEEWQQRRRTFEPGEDIVVPFLKSKGIHRIDKLILTHDDQDHIGGAAAVMEMLDVKELIMPQALKDDFMDSSVWASAVEEQCAVTFVKGGEGWRIGQDQFKILHPVKYTESSNESSLVLLATINGMDWLFTGDLGAEGESELLGRHPGLTADIIKVGHHGSKHSSSPQLLDQLDAKLAIISAGKNNRYGHPHPEVLEAFRNRGIQVLRTDEQGSIRYRYLGGMSKFSATLP